MTVETFDPRSDSAAQIDITMSDAVVSHVLGQQNGAGQVLRLSLTESGCSGYTGLGDFSNSTQKRNLRI